jgi:type II secretory pathway component PulC
MSSVRTLSLRRAVGASRALFKKQGVNVQVRIAIAVESDQARWVAYGASDTPEREIMAAVREMVAGHPVTMWIEVQMPEQQPATVPAHIVLHSRKHEC